jgi:hypothetical protein
LWIAVAEAADARDICSALPVSGETAVFGAEPAIRRAPRVVLRLRLGREHGRRANDHRYKKDRSHREVSFHFFFLAPLIYAGMGRADYANTVFCIASTPRTALLSQARVPGRARVFAAEVLPEFREKFDDLF